MKTAKGFISIPILLIIIAVLVMGGILGYKSLSKTNPSQDNTTSSEWACGENVTFTYNGKLVTYGTVVGANNRCWLDRNLGASRVAQGIHDLEAYGDLFQWGRLDDGHQIRTSPTTNTLSNTDIPGHSNFIKTNDPPYDWRSPQNNNLWQGVNGINNPCPSGWRIPTVDEWDTEIASWGSGCANCGDDAQNAIGAYNSPLKLPTAGFRLASDNDKVLSENWGYDYIGMDLVHEGEVSKYWTTTVTSPNTSYYLLFSGSPAQIAQARGRGIGCSVRCIKD